MDVRTRRTGVRLRVDFAALRVVVAFFFAVVLLLALVALPAVRRDDVFLAVARLVVARFAVLRVADAVLVRRVEERTDAFVFFRDAAAFNCFPLFGVLVPALEQDAQELPESALFS